MKRISLILILAVLLAALSFSAVFARSDFPGASGPGAQGGEIIGMASSGCWGAELQGQVINGKLYAGPGFNLDRFLRQNPNVDGSKLVVERTSSQNGCVIWILPSE